MIEVSDCKKNLKKAALFYEQERSSILKKLRVFYLKHSIRKEISFEEFEGEFYPYFIEAIERYDQRRLCSFSSYLNFYIRRALKEVKLTLLPAKVSKFYREKNNLTDYTNNQYKLVIACKTFDLTVANVKSKENPEFELDKAQIRQTVNKVKEKCRSSTDRNLLAHRFPIKYTLDELSNSSEKIFGRKLTKQALSLRWIKLKRELEMELSKIV